MRRIDTAAYVSMLRELVEEGKEVNMLITGSSMAPFLIHERDRIWFQKPERALKKGDMVFYQRESGQYVMHRICKVHKDCYDIIGDGQTEIETSVKREQIFAVVTKVQRKEKILKPGDFWWEFFAKVWIRMIPMRGVIARVYGKINR